MAKRMAAPGAVVHWPLQEGNCVGCHDAHASSEPRLLARAGAALCGECHDLEDRSFAASHARPLKKKTRCWSCHDPHVATNGRLFVQSGVGLCDGCHDRSREGWQRIHLANGAIDSPCGECHKDQHAKPQG
jgi:predicted CXXCH cytochrome family protein